MVRVALVSPNYYPRTCGVGDYTMRVGQELLRRGMQARVFSRAPAEPHPLTPELDVVSAPGGPQAVCVRLAREVRAYRPDIVLLEHVPFMFGARRYGFPTSTAFALQVRRACDRLVVMAHEMFPAWSKRLDHAASAALDRAQILALCHLADAFFVSTESRISLVASWPIRHDRMHVAPIGANADPIPKTFDRSRKTFDIGVFSTLSYPDQAELTVDVFALVAREIPTARLILIGDVNDRAGSPLARLIPQHPHRDRIVLTGKIDLAAAAKSISLLDAYLFPSNTGANTRSSTLPIALGCGVPVFAARGPETGSWFEHENNVLLADRWNAAEMARAALRLWHEPALGERIGEGGRRLHATKLSWPRIVDRLLQPLEFGGRDSQHAFSPHA